MEVFRSRNFKSVVYGALIVVTVIVFVIGFRPNQTGRGASASLREECVANVRGTCISPREWKTAQVFFMRRIGDPQQAAAMGLKRIVLDGLVERELLNSDAKRLGLSVSENELNDQLLSGVVHLSLPSEKESIAYSFKMDNGRVMEDFRDPKTKQFDMKTYDRAVRRLAGSPVEFREMQASELLAAKMRDLVRAPVRVSDVEALESYIGEKSSATITHIDISQKFAERYALAVTDAEVEKWAAEENNKKAVEAAVQADKEVAIPKAATIRHILVKVDPGATNEAKAVALGRLSEAAARIKKGEPFGLVARDVSEDPGSGQKGGAYGDDMLDKFVTPFKVAAKALKPGEITPGAVETQFGFHLIERDDPAKAGEVEASLPKWAARSLYTKSKSLEAAKDLADKIFASVKATPWLSAGADDAVKGALASLRNPQGPGFAAPLTVIPAAPESAGDAGAASASADGGAVASEAPAYAAKAVTATTDPDRPQPETSSSFNRGGDIPSVTGESATKVMSFAFSGKPGDVYSELVRSDNGFVIVMLKERKSATKEEFEKERDTYVQGLLAAKQNEALGIYVKRLRESAKSDIKVNEAMLRDPSRGDGGAAPVEEQEQEQD